MGRKVELQKYFRFLFSNDIPMMEKETLQVFGVKSLANASYGAFMEAVKSLIAKGTTEKLGLKAEEFSAFEALLVLRSTTAARRMPRPRNLMRWMSNVIAC